MTFQSRKMILMVASGVFLAACATTATPAEQGVVTEQAEPTTGAKNVILMVSDGIGFNGWLAADYYQGLAGQQSYQVTRPDGTQPVIFGMSHDALNLLDASGDLITDPADIATAVSAIEQGYDPIERWDTFEGAFANDFDPLRAPYSSYTDSAAAGTALMSGRKTSNGRLNVDWSGEQSFQTIAELAMDQGRSAGAVSSVMAAHATPDAVISHNVSRNNYAEIFNEMVASELDVIMGGGHPFYDASGTYAEPEAAAAYRYVGGEDTLAALTSDAGLNGYTFIDSKDDFEALAAGDVQTARVVGIARTTSTLQAAREDLPAADTPSGLAYIDQVPDLATMSIGALNVLSQDEDGLFLMIEGGAVDWMGHGNNMPRYIEEQIDFNASVAAVIDWIESNSSWDDTLLVPLWAIGKGSEDFAGFTQMDLNAQGLWGEPYSWDGRFVDNTDVFAVMRDALR